MNIDQIFAGNYTVGISPDSQPARKKAELGNIRVYSAGLNRIIILFFNVLMFLDDKAQLINFIRKKHKTGDEIPGSYLVLT